MGGKEEKINEWFSVVSESSGELTRAAKVIDEWLMEKIGIELNKGVVRWKAKVLVWYKWRVKFMRWRLEKWIPGIMRECEIDFQDIGDWYEEQNVVYVIFNLRNRKRYIGETKQWLKPQSNPQKFLGIFFIIIISEMQMIYIKHMQNMVHVSAFIGEIL